MHWGLVELRCSRCDNLIGTRFSADSVNGFDILCLQCSIGYAQVLSYTEKDKENKHTWLFRKLRDHFVNRFKGYKSNAIVDDNCNKLTAIMEEMDDKTVSSCRGKTNPLSFLSSSLYVNTRYNNKKYVDISVSYRL